MFITFEIQCLPMIPMGKLFMLFLDGVAGTRVDGNESKC